MRVPVSVLAGALPVSPSASSVPQSPLTSPVVVPALDITPPASLLASLLSVSCPVSPVSQIPMPYMFSNPQHLCCSACQAFSESQSQRYHEYEQASSIGYWFPDDSEVQCTSIARYQTVAKTFPRSSTSLISTTQCTRVPSIVPQSQFPSSFHQIHTHTHTHVIVNFWRILTDKNTQSQVLTICILFTFPVPTVPIFFLLNGNDLKD